MSFLNESHLTQSKCLNYDPAFYIPESCQLVWHSSGNMPQKSQLYLLQVIFSHRHLAKSISEISFLPPSKYHQALYSRSRGHLPPFLFLFQERKGMDYNPAPLTPSLQSILMYIFKFWFCVLNVLILKLDFRSIGRQVGRYVGRYSSTSIHH